MDIVDLFALGFAFLSGCIIGAGLSELQVVLVIFCAMAIFIALLDAANDSRRRGRR